MSDAASSSATFNMEPLLLGPIVMPDIVDEFVTVFDDGSGRPFNEIQY